MSARTVKVAISLPKDVATEIEHLRHKLDLSRSQVILEGVSMWLKKREEEALIKKYIRGYKRRPEKPTEVSPIFFAGLDSFSEDEW